MDYFKRLVNVIIALAVLVGIPYQFGAGWLFMSWFPAIFVFIVLDE